METVYQQEVESSRISKLVFKFDDSKANPYKLGVLTTTFTSGSIYEYYKVPLVIYQTLISAESIGKTFQTLIINRKYEYKRLRPE